MPKTSMSSFGLVKPNQEHKIFQMKLIHQHEEPITGVIYSLISTAIPKTYQSGPIIQKEPVRVEIEDDVEYIFYDEKRMIENVPYLIKFYGNDIFVIKRANKIEMVDHIET